MDLFADDGGTGGSIAPIRLHEATRRRYLNYALSVITSRALPDVRDGLKPVQRRILFGMYRDLKLRADSRFLKSARVVGEVMGKYHPHGDQSIYDAMVRLAQPFAMRYPLVDGQGNFGSIDGDSAAAMRYTEARLRGLSEDLLAEITRGTVDWRPTYDGQLSEPVVLPAQVPNLLVNGATGIAVGMATNIPPHNVGEVVDALIELIDEPGLSTWELCRHVKGPDFPTGGEILSSAEEIQKVYETGQGPIKLRGAYTVETIGRKKCVVVTSVPYAVNKGTLVEKIAQHVIAKNVPQIVDVRDESTDDVRIVLELKRGAKPEVAMAYLYKNTPLQQNFNVNLTCLVPTADPQVQAPQRVGLREVLRHFLDFRLEVVTRRLRHRLAELRKAIHRLEGFEIIFDALDEIIALIRASEGKSDAARKMMDRYPLDEEQTEAILELKLYRLAKLEILIVRQELADKRAEAARIEGQLADEEARWSIVRSELLEIRSAYADERRTTIIGHVEQQDFSPEAYIIRETAYVMVSRMGRVKRQKGFSEVSNIRVPDGDEIGWVIRTDTRQTVTFYTQFGSAYVLRVDDIAATTGYGEPVQSFFSFKDGERIVGMSCSDDKLYVCDPDAEPDIDPEGPQLPLMVSISKSGKATRFPPGAHSEVSTKNGRRYHSLAKGDEVVGVHLGEGGEVVCLATEQARAILFAAAEIPPKSSAVRGVNAIKLGADDAVLSFRLARKKREGLTVRTNRGSEKIIRETSYKPVARGGKGTEVIKRGRFVEFDRPVEVYEPGSGIVAADEEEGEGA